MIKKERRAIFIILLAFIFIISSIAEVSAITAKIGSSRMVLRAEVGETVERYIKIINDNEVPVTIDLSVSGDLTDYLDLRKKSFVLNPKEEENAYFVIKAKEPGTTETKINVKFTPAEGNSVGLSATVIVIASGEGELPEENEAMQDNNETLIDVKPKINNINNQPQNNSLKISPLLLLATTTILVIILLIILVIYYKKTKIKRGVRRTRAK